MEKIVKRKELASKIRSYLDGTISLADLADFELTLANNHYVCEDVDGEGDSITNEILHIINMSDVNNGLIEERVPILLELLESKEDSWTLIKRLYAEYYREGIPSR